MVAVQAQASKRRRVSDALVAKGLADQADRLVEQELETAAEEVKQAIIANPKLLMPVKALINNGGKMDLPVSLGAGVRT